MIPSPHRIDRQVVYGFLFLGLVGLLVAGTIAQYRGVFEDNVVVTVESDRAGLTLAKGAPIKLRGVEIGDVGEVRTRGGKVFVELEIESDQVRRVPADVTAQIVPPTAFGAKYVQLTAPRRSTAGPIAAGGVIPATRVTVEVDEAFENLTEVLAVARPAEVNAALTAGAAAVDDRGRQIGDLIRASDRYLTRLDPALPALSKDLHVTDDVLDLYAAARADLVGTLRHTADISDTLVSRRPALHAVERRLDTFSTRADALLRDSAKGIHSSLWLFRPVTATLARYAPELPCTILGLAAVNGPMEAAIGGTNPGLTTQTRLMPGRSRYTYGTNLPQIGDDRGPACSGLPYVTPAEAAVPPPFFQTGANPQAGADRARAQATFETLLGLRAGGAVLP